MNPVAKTDHETVKPILLFGYGNPGRGDDALGPGLLEEIEKSAEVDHRQVELITDFQLQIEHALDMLDRQVVLFIDASVDCRAPFELTMVEPLRDHSFTTHSISPGALLEVYRTVTSRRSPSAFLLSICGESFGLGEPLSEAAAKHQNQAKAFVERLLKNPDSTQWINIAEHARNLAA